MTDQVDMQSVVTRFESFINDTLKEDLRVLNEKIQKLELEMVEYTKIKKTLLLLDEESYCDEYKTQVDIGMNFYIEAKVKDPNNLLFDIGLKHYLELNRKEAIKYCDTRTEALVEAITNLTKKSSETKAHIKLMLIGIGELQNVNTDLSS